MSSKNTTIKILFISNASGLLGADRSLLLLLKNLNREYITPYVTIPKKGLFSHELDLLKIKTYTIRCPWWIHQGNNIGKSHQ